MFFRKRIFYHITLFSKLCQVFSKTIANLTVNIILSKKARLSGELFQQTVYSFVLTMFKASAPTEASRHRE